MKRRSAASRGMAGKGEVGGKVIMAPCEFALLPAIR